VHRSPAIIAAPRANPESQPEKARDQNQIVEVSEDADLAGNPADEGQLKRQESQQNVDERGFRAGAGGLLRRRQEEERSVAGVGLATEDQSRRADLSSGQVTADCPARSAYLGWIAAIRSSSFAPSNLGSKTVCGQEFIEQDEVEPAVGLEGFGQPHAGAADLGVDRAGGISATSEQPHAVTTREPILRLGPGRKGRLRLLAAGRLARAKEVGPLLRISAISSRLIVR